MSKGEISHTWVFRLSDYSLKNVGGVYKEKFADQK